MDDSAYLLRVELRELLCWHIIDEKVISNLGIGEDSLLVGLSYSLSKDSWILRVEEEIDPRELNVFASHIPLATVHGSFFIPSLDQDCFPFTGAIFVLEKPLCWDRREATFFVDSKLNPFTRQAAVILEIVEWLKREPVGLIRLGISVVDAKLQQQLLDVEGGKEFSLTIDDNLPWWLSRDWLEWLHDLGVWVSHALSLPGIEALVDVWVSEIVLADDACSLTAVSCFSISFFACGAAINLLNDA